MAGIRAGSVVVTYVRKLGWNCRDAKQVGRPSLIRTGLSFKG
jgi:hypothetical protein